MAEIWMPVPGYEGIYEVSNQGRVASLSRSDTMKNGVVRTLKGRVLAEKRHQGGYRQVCLAYRNEHKYPLIHRLVLAAFVGPCPDGYEVNHINGNKTDNRLENLEYVTSSENKFHAFERGLSIPRGPKGERASGAKLNAQQVLKIREMATQGHTLSVIAEHFNVSTSTVRHIVSRHTWRHI